VAAWHPIKQWLAWTPPTDTAVSAADQTLQANLERAADLSVTLVLATRAPGPRWRQTATDIRHRLEPQTWPCCCLSIKILATLLIDYPSHPKPHLLVKKSLLLAGFRASPTAAVKSRVAVNRRASMDGLVPAPATRNH
jgi:hypothetical protein